MADEGEKGVPSFIAGVIEATATVFLTTLDDCLWLIPFVAQAPAGRTLFLRGALFVITLVTMAAVTSLVAVVLDKSLSALYDDDEPFVSNEIPFVGAGAILCWSLAGFLYYRSWKKRQQRRQARESVRRMPSNIIIENKVSDGLVLDDSFFDSSEGNGNNLNYGAIKPDEAAPTTAPSYLRATSSLSCDSDIELSMEMVGDMIPSSIRSFVGSSQAFVIICLTVLGR